MVSPALEAADGLAERGIEVGVMDAVVAHPVDAVSLCAEATKYGAVVTVEEHVLSGGFGAAVAAALQDAGLHHVRMARLGVQDRFVPHGPRDRLLAECGLDARSVEGVCIGLLADAASHVPE
jgi:1-deoxy-D-xylulose-5-phosphate synthase